MAYWLCVIMYFLWFNNMFTQGAKRGDAGQTTLSSTALFHPDHNCWLLLLLRSDGTRTPAASERIYATTNHRWGISPRPENDLKLPLGTPIDTVICDKVKAIPACTPISYLEMITGPRGYISPDWYDIDIQAPTWNYIAVVLIVRLEVLPDHRLRDIIDRLSDMLAAELAPNSSGKAPK